MALHQGDMILSGKYHVLCLIGEGAMARVWLAAEPRFGNRQVPLKEPGAGLAALLQALEAAHGHRLEIVPRPDRFREPVRSSRTEGLCLIASG